MRVANLRERGNMCMKKKQAMEIIMTMLFGAVMIFFLTACGMKERIEKIEDLNITPEDNTQREQVTEEQTELSIPKMTKAEFPRVDGSTATIPLSVGPVSYTHLDVYKRQG